MDESIRRDRRSLNAGHTHHWPPVGMSIPHVSYTDVRRRRRTTSDVIVTEQPLTGDRGSGHATDAFAESRGNSIF